MRKRIYLDYATTTPLDGAVERAMRPFWSQAFGNPSSLHSEGVQAKQALSAARTKVARDLQAHTDEIVFTGSGTEANNLAIAGLIKGMKESDPSKKLHVITSVIEHSSVLKAVQSLEKWGVRVTYVPVDSEGIIDMKVLEKSLCPETVLVSVMYANNEIGTIQPIRKISNILLDFAKHSGGKTAKPFFHVDACQAPLYLDINQNHLGADLVALDGHKMYGPKGVGMLYVRHGTPLSSLSFGGEQERGLRSGTENVPLIVGFTEALSRAVQGREGEQRRLTVLREHFLSEIRRLIPQAILNGSVEYRLPNNVNISIPRLNAEFAVVRLDALGVACSAKSACLEGGDESYVVKALGRNDGSERSSLRFTLGGDTSKRDIKESVQRLEKVVREQ